MSSLIPERQLVISPSLAATIGLEEAVMLQVLSDINRFGGGQPRGGYRWINIDLEVLREQLPFWNNSELQRIGNSLRDKGIILLDTAPRGQLLFAMNEFSAADDSAASGERQHIDTHIDNTPAPNTAPPAPPSRRGSATLLAENWRPDEDLLHLLTLNHGIPREFSLQQLEDFLLYWRDRQQVSHSWPSKFRQHVLKEWRFHQGRQAAAAAQQAQQTAHADLDRQWQPSPDALEILHRAGINAEFIEDAIPEFVLYWRERGEASNTWNSKFIAHIRRQWARYTAALQQDYEPREIPANWQPNEDVYDILRMANIDIDFARQLIPEFVLFWRDSRQIHRSWNTKFLQHVKYQWATRHHYAGQQPAAINQGASHAGQPGSHSATHPSATNELRHSPFKQLTDRSWAEGIVDGI